VRVGDAQVVARAARVPRPLLARAAVGAEIARLEGQRAAATDRALRADLARRVVELSTRNRVMSSLTGFLVLETEDDYRRFGIARTALADILVAGAAGVEVVGRRDITLIATDPAVAARPAVEKDATKADKRKASHGGSIAADDDGRAAVDLDESGGEEGKEDEDGEAARSGDADGNADTETTAGRDQRPRPMRVAPPDDPEPAAPPPPPAASSPPWSAPAAGVADRAAPRADRGPGDAPAQGHRASTGELAREERAAEVHGLAQPAAAEPPPPEDDGPKAGPPPWTGTFAEVMQQLQRGQKAAGLAAAWDWRRREPGDVLALIALGEALEAADQPAAAARAYGSVIDLFPGRADLRRFAAERLERVGAAGRALAIDSYRQAVASRPDHLTGHRLLAYALVRAGDVPAAFAAIEAGLAQSYPDGRFRGGTRILSEDLGVIGAAWIARAPGQRAAIEARLAKAGSALATSPTLRFVLYWETDANDVDFHIRDGRGRHAFFRQMQLASGGELYADVTTGYGPECFTIPGTPRAYPYSLQLHYYSRGPMGYGMGVLEVVRHDGRGGLGFEHRPYVIMADGAFVDLGTVDDRTAAIGTTRLLAN
jgi:hypothetical protein